ncbi:MAG: hypothetical protein PHO03_01710 [Candidatus Omnitrophica bacterium]|jgi:hypothetical protein|nr:hypothetical protein [Candidatus Omnitrophota bacterium]MDD5053423.1 hypothetical protein [Sulfuricurvum sp.]
MASTKATMFYAWDKEGTRHSFHHAVDWKTVIQTKGFSPTPPGTVVEPEPEKLEGEAIDGIEIDNKQKIKEIEMNPNIIIGEKKIRQSKTKIDR